MTVRAQQNNVIPVLSDIRFISFCLVCTCVIAMVWDLNTMFSSSSIIYIFKIHKKNVYKNEIITIFYCCLKISRKIIDFYFCFVVFWYLILSTNNNKWEKASTCLTWFCCKYKCFWNKRNINRRHNQTNSGRLEP